jgi:hypothetical protein
VKGGKEEVQGASSQLAGPLTISAPCLAFKLFELCAASPLSFGELTQPPSVDLFH